MSAGELSPLQRGVLASGRWFTGLPPPMQQALYGGARVITLRAGEAVFLRGDDNNGLYATLAGSVCFGAVNQAGKQLVVGLAEPPQWFGEVALLDGGPRTHDTWAETDATLAHLPLPAITRWLQAHPAHWQYVGQLAAHKLRVVCAAIEDTTLQPPRERLIRCPASLARGYGQREAPLPQTLRVSQERLGSMLALSRQTINALLQGLEREQLVVCVRGGVRIPDVARLLQREAAIR